jgi:hypothetical protein
MFISVTFHILVSVHACVLLIHAVLYIYARLFLITGSRLIMDKQGRNLQETSGRLVIFPTKIKRMMVVSNVCGSYKSFHYLWQFFRIDLSILLHQAFRDTKGIRICLHIETNCTGCALIFSLETVTLPSPKHGVCCIYQRIKAKDHSTWLQTPVFAVTVSEYIHNSDNCPRVSFNSTCHVYASTTVCQSLYLWIICRDISRVILCNKDAVVFL